jgi:glyoxylase-like metal-dependent hydrolase (beta-lactamase superfamily II)
LLPDFTQSAATQRIPLPLLQTIPVGGLQTNCYILTSGDSSECAVIDPGAESQRIIDAVKAAGLELRYVLCTHGHADHTGGVAPLHDELGGQFYLGASDTAYSESAPDWLVAALGGFIAPPSPDAELEAVESIQLGSSEIAFIRTPGHTPGSTCFLFEGMVFTGDTLFKGSIGRYDLPGGDGRQELESIRDKLLVLPDETPVYPGHGPSSTIGEERVTNPYLIAAN